MTVLGDTPFSAFVSSLAGLAGDPASAAAYAGSYLAAQAAGCPVIEGDIAHFLYPAPAGVVVGVGGDWNGFDGRKGRMEPIGGGLLHYEQRFELDARLDYYFYEVPAGQWDQWVAGTLPRAAVRSVLDPGNPRFGESGFGPRSELAMPAYRRPAVTLPQPGTPADRLQPAGIVSAALKQDRAYVVYLPAGYAAAAGPYPSVYFQDGGDYLTIGHAPAILDNLIAAGAIPPLVAVFVSPVDRDREYHCNPAYVRFFCDELVPALHADYALLDDPAARAVVGPSLGALISLYLGRQRPDRFGLIGAQSAAVRSWGQSQFDARRSFAARRRLPLRLHLSIGRYENCFATDAAGRCRDLRTGVRELRAVLDRAGYPLDYAEYPQGHSWGLWRDCLPEALRYFFGTGPGAPPP